MDQVLDFLVHQARDWKWTKRAAVVSVREVRCSVERAADAGKSAASGRDCMSSQASVDIVAESLPLLAPLPDSDEAIKANSLPYTSSLSIIKKRYFSLREFCMFTPTVAMPV